MQYHMIKYITAAFLSGVLGIHAQTITDPQPSAGDPVAMLELPPVTVVEEGEKSDDSLGDDKAEADPEGKSDHQQNDDEKKPEADGGIQIQVEKSSGKSGAKQSKGAVKIDAPWPAKPISLPPAGWKFAPAPKGTQPFRTQVKLVSGNTVDLSITPYVLVPITDGNTSIKISEPGYEAQLQYAQKNTLGVMLQNSTAEIENHEKHAADAIQRLQQLLSSLPRK